MCVVVMVMIVCVCGGGGGGDSVSGVVRGGGVCDGDSNDDGVCVCVCTLTHFTTCHYSQPLFRSPGGPLSGPHPQLRFLRSLCLYRLHPLGPGQLSQILRFLRQSVTVLVTLEHSCCPCTPLVHVVFRDNPVSLLSVSALLSLSVFVRFSLSLSLCPLTTY